LTEKLIKILTNEWQIHRSPARGYYDLLNITVNAAPVETSTPKESLPKIPLIETSYQNNRLVIGLTSEQGYGTNTGIVINWFGQLIAVDEYKHFQVYLEVRGGRPVNPMSPSRRGVIKDEAWKQFSDFILNSFLGYFTQTPAADINPLALQLFYRDYPGPAAALPCFVAARRNCYESGGDVSKLSETSAPEVFRYERQPLILADGVQILEGEEEIVSAAYGLHSFLELTGAVYKVIEGDQSRLAIRHLWWKPGERIELPTGCPKVFHGSGQWGVGTEDEAPLEWRSVGNHIVFTFNDPSNWDVSDVDFTVGGADPQDFYQTDAWAGFDPNNDEHRSYEEMSESYRESCGREIRNVIGNAVPENFSWEDLLRFVPEGLQIAAVTPEYKSLRNRRPVNLLLILSNDEMLRLRLY
jgi:hypothetical protein